MPPQRAGPAFRGLSIAQTVGLLLLWICVVILVAIEWFQLPGAEVAPGGDMTVLVPALLIAWALTLWVGLGMTGFSAREAFPLRRFSPAAVPGILLASPGITLLLMELLSFLPYPDWARKMLGEPFAHTPGWLVFLTVAVVAPVTEEPFFRGLLLRGFLGRYRVSTAVVLSAVLFAAIHVNPWQGFSALVLGLAGAWLVLRTGSILPGMIWHATQNSSALLLGYLLLRLGYSPKALAGPVHLPAWLVLVAVLAVAAGLSILRRTLPAPGYPPERLPVRPDAPAPGATGRRVATIFGVSLLLLAGTYGVRAYAQSHAAERWSGCYTFSARQGSLGPGPGGPGKAVRARLSLVPYDRRQPGKYRVLLLDTASAHPSYWFAQGGWIQIVTPYDGKGGMLLRLHGRGSGLEGTASRYGTAQATPGPGTTVRAVRVACPEARPAGQGTDRGRTGASAGAADGPRPSAKRTTP